MTDQRSVSKGSMLRLDVRVLLLRGHGLSQCPTLVCWILLLGCARRLLSDKLQFKHAGPRVDAELEPHLRSVVPPQSVRCERVAAPSSRRDRWPADWAIVAVRPLVRREKAEG